MFSPEFSVSMEMLRAWITFTSKNQLDSFLWLLQTDTHGEQQGAPSTKERAKSELEDGKFLWIDFLPGFHSLIIAFNCCTDEVELLTHLCNTEWVHTPHICKPQLQETGNPFLPLAVFWQQPSLTDIRVTFEPSLHCVSDIKFVSTTCSCSAAHWLSRRSFSGVLSLFDTHWLTGELPPAHCAVYPVTTWGHWQCTLSFWHARSV